MFGEVAQTKQFIFFFLHLKKKSYHLFIIYHCLFHSILSVSSFSLSRLGLGTETWYYYYYYGTGANINGSNWTEIKCEFRYLISVPQNMEQFNIHS